MRYFLPAPSARRLRGRAALSPATRTLGLLSPLILAPLALPPLVAHAQATSQGALPNVPGRPASAALPANVLPALQIASSVLGADGNVTVTLPPLALASSRLTIGVFEAGRPVRVAEIQRDFTIANGRLQASFNMQASPGAYEIRLVTSDKAHTPLSLPAPLLVPGVDREPGWWLLNGSPASVFPDAKGDSLAVRPTAPFFISGLKRDANRKAKTSPDLFVPANGPLPFKTLDLPSLREMLVPNYDFTALRSGLQRQVAEAQARGERGFLGFVLRLSRDADFGVAPVDYTAIGPTMTRLRETLAGVAPDAALIVEVDVFATHVSLSQMLDTTARYADAISVRTYGDMDLNDTLWIVKNARRNAEELPNYDLPIFVSSTHQPIYGIPRLDNAQFTLDLLMNGATGITDASSPAWLPVVARNLPLFVGSVTLEDIGILPAPERDTSQHDNSPLYDRLRGAGRIPLLARAKTSKDKAESFAISLGDRVSPATIEALRATASDGARIYIEGAPTLDEKGTEAGWRLGTLVGGTITPLGKDASSKKVTSMTLEDGWTFGTARGTQVNVEQTVSVTLNKGTVAGQAKQEKGKYTLTEPRVTARLADGTPGLVINPVGKGEVIWMPHRPLESGSVVDVSGALITTGPNVTDPSQELHDVSSGAFTRYYASIAAYAQPALVQLRSTDPKSEANSVRVALRRSPRGAYLLALFNSSPVPASVAASIDGVAGVALDLATEKELPLTVRGYSSEAGVTIAPRGWSLIAFAETRKALDEERNAPRLQARLR